MGGFEDKILADYVPPSGVSKTEKGPDDGLVIGVAFLNLSEKFNEPKLGLYFLFSKELNVPASLSVPRTS